MKFVLIILDGLGLRHAREANAFQLASTPVLDRLMADHPCARLETSGPAVGLPIGVMGNSEVGHMTIGAGRIIKHDLMRINDAIADGSFAAIPELRLVFSRVKKSNSGLHLLGLLSDGRVHSHIDHVIELLRLAKHEGLEKVYLHAITDGRDTSPTSGIDYVRQMVSTAEEIGVGSIATVMGRYYAMDRDRRWERTEIAYRAYVNGEGELFTDPVAAIRASYEQEITDEFIRPKIIAGADGMVRTIRGQDELFCFNFRADRMRQITSALGGKDFQEFQRIGTPVFCTTMTSYDNTFDFPVLFKKTHLERILPEILDSIGYRQLRIAETEKYAHVTYFLNGGEENPYSHEDRILVPSPKVATYDLQPEMSAPEVKEKVLQAINSNQYDCVIMNLANADMVGHTGDLQAAVMAVETIDEIVGQVVEATVRRGGAVFVTSDHGNLEMMTDEETGEAHTAHTLNPVPLILVNSDSQMGLKPCGGLADIAPTILDYLDIPIPEEMTGKSLLLTE